jgi:hypothetical protein
MTRAVRTRLLLLVALTLAFKLWLASVFPFTGDEAYFTIWGAAPDLGFYDHPPMIGWLLAPLLRLSWSEWVLRLPVVLMPYLIAAGVYAALQGRDAEKAALAAAAYLLVPINVWNVFITTDTPLILLSFFSALAFWQATLRRSLSLHALAGALLGLAFLSKYFAVLLGLVYLVYVASSPRTERNWRGLAITLGCALPLVGVNLWWNYENCWANLMFNLYNRHDDAGLSWKTPLLYAATLLYVLSPVALVQLVRGRGWAAALWRDASSRFFAVACALPLALFAGLSAVKLVGLHWVLSFVPFFFIALALVLTRGQLRASAVFLGLFSLAHVAGILAASAFPLETWKSWRKYDGIVFHFRIEEVVRELERYRGEFELAADGYSPAVTASYYRQRLRTTASAEAAAGQEGDWRKSYVFVFGPASSHARHDDILTDFTRLEGRNILVLRKNPPEDGDYRPYFHSVEYRTLPVSGATFHLVLGRGFNYAAYRDRVLAPIRDRYYRIPGYLPQGHCYFCERYFAAQTCVGR